MDAMERKDEGPSVTVPHYSCPSLTHMKTGGATPPQEVPYSDFMKLVKEHGPDALSRVRVSPER